MGEFSVSVIIPVYNAEKFLQKAVQSALVLEEVGEIILIEDKSPDNALKICEELEKREEKVKLFQHPDKGNHGAGASRNLGIEKANCDYIAFLDADDVYLPNRFKKDKEILLSDPTVDGVYNALGIHYYSEKARRIFIDAGYEYQEFLSLTESVAPEELFTVLFGSHPKVKGEFSTITLTVRRTIFDNVGVFNTSLRLKQDTHLWRRMAAECRLASGNLTEAVALRGVHEANRMVVKADHKEYDKYWWTDLNRIFRKRKIPAKYMEIFQKNYFYFQIRTLSRFKRMIRFIGYYMKHPGLIKNKMSSFDYHFNIVFGQNWFSRKVLSIKNKIYK